MDNEYAFEFHIPSDIISRVNDFKIEPYYLRLKEYANKHPILGTNIYREYNTFFIRAKFDIPFSFNISNKKEVTIS